MSLDIKGKVFQGATLEALIGHRVDVIQGAGVNATVIATGQTDTVGNFSIAVPPSVVQAMLASGGDGLSVRVYDACDKLVQDTADKARWSPASAGEVLRVPIGPETDDPCCRASSVKRDTPAVVRGIVRYEQGGVAVGVYVYASHHAIGATQALGVAKTDEKGQFYIRYVAPTVAGQRLPVGLSLRVEKIDATLLMETGVIENAPPDLDVTLTLLGANPDALTEFADVSAKIAPVAGSVELRSLTPQDITLLAARSGVDLDKTRALVLANRFAHRAGLHGVTISVEHVYGMLRTGMPERFLDLFTSQTPKVKDALHLAGERSVINAPTVSELSAIAAAVRSVGVRESLKDPSTGDATPFGTVLGYAVSTPSDQETFVNHWYDHRDDPTLFWSEIGGISPFNDSDVFKQVQFYLQLGILTGYRVPVVAAIKVRTDLPTFDALATLTVSDWNSLLQGISGPATWLPDDLEGVTVADKIMAYAKRLAASMEAAFPTVAVKTALGVASAVWANGAFADVKSFLDGATAGGFRIEDTQIDLYLAGKSNVFPETMSEAQKKETIATLKRIQRIYRVAPKSAVLATLVEKGIQGASDIVAMGKDAYVSATYAVQSAEEATAQFHNALRVEATSLAIAAEYGGRDVGMTVMSAPSEDLAHASAIPNASVEGLFGSQDFCGCEHCRSVFSPAAYFTQVLQALKLHAHREGTSQTGLDVLLAIRPDFVKIGLCCANSDTPMPYLDVVNEILEDRVAREGSPMFRSEMDASPGGSLDPHTALRIVSPVTPESNTDVAPVLTTRTEAELRASPEYTWYPAYRVLASNNGSIYPFNLPFEQPREEARLYLDHLGVDGAALRRTFASPDAPGGDPSGTLRSEVIIERLRLAGADLSLLTGTADGNLCARAWGFMSESQLTNIDPLDAFLDRAGVTLDELRYLQSSDFLHKRFSRPVFPEIVPCKLSDLKLYAASGISLFVSEESRTTFLDGLHRMLRLRARTGWSLVEIDAMFSALFDNTNGSGVITLRELELLALADDLARSMKRSRVEVLALWGTLERRKRYDGTRNVYDALFLDPSVRSPIDPGFAEDSTSPAVQILPTAWFATLSAVFGLRVADIELLNQKLGLSKPFDWRMLGPVVAHVMLAKAAQLSLADLFELKVLSGIDPCAPVTHETMSSGEAGGPKATQHFIETVDALRRAGFSVSDVNDLVRGEHAEGSSVTPDRDAAVIVTSELQAAMSSLCDAPSEVEEIPDTTTTEGFGEQSLRLKEELRNFLTVEIADAFLADIYAPPTDPAMLASFQSSARQYLSLLLDPCESDRLLAALGDPSLSSAQRVTLVLRSVVRHSALPTDRGVKRCVEVLSTLMDGEVASALADTIVKGVRTHTGGVVSEFSTALADPGVTAILGACGLESFHASMFLSGASDSTVAERRNAARPGLVLLAALKQQRRMRGMKLLVEKLSGITKLDLGTTAALLTSDPHGGPAAHVLLPSNANRPIIEAWLDPDFALHPDAGAFDMARAAYMRFSRAAALVRRCNLSRDALSIYVSGSQTGGWMSFRALPAGPVGAPSTTDFDALLRSCSLIGLQRRLPAQRIEVLDLLRGFENAGGGMVMTDTLIATYDNFSHRLADALGVSFDTVRSMLPSVGAAPGTSSPLVSFLSAAAASPFASLPVIAARIHVMLDALDALRRLGIGMTEARAWTATGVATAGAEYFTEWMRRAASIRGFVRAKYGDAQWRAVSKPLMDSLRIKQRDALAGWLLTRLRGTEGCADYTLDDLYGHYLIDVEMGPDMMTSRLRQAIASMQLFVQRALMNIEQRDERKVTITPTFAARWKWMKRYRLWEANRKVFYYPENWIEPELRRDKSEFFKELEADLLQQDLTDERAEKAVRRYLERLDEVARLDVRAFYHQRAEYENGALVSPDTLHVFARTMATPAKYFYRKRINGSVWTPWEKLDIDIPSDHLLPARMNRRLYLFWPEFAEKEVPHQTVDTGRGSTPDTPTALSFKMAWSRLEGDRWTVKKVSKTEQPIETDGERATIFFRLAEDDGVRIASLASGASVRRATTYDLRFSACDDDFELGRDVLDDETLAAFVGEDVRVGTANVISQHLRFMYSGGETSGTQLSFAWFADGRMRPILNPRADFEPRDAVTVLPSHMCPGFVPDRETFFWRDSARSYVIDPIVVAPGRRTVSKQPAPDRAGGKGDLYSCKQPAPPKGLKAGSAPGAKEDIIDVGDGAIEIKGAGSSGSKVTYVVATGADGATGASKPAGMRRSTASVRHSASTETTPREGVRVDGGGMLRFTRFYYPFVCSFVRALEERGIEGLFDLAKQQQVNSGFNFVSTYDPNTSVVYHEPSTASPTGYPDERVSFSDDDVYGLYNWELFFHVPFLVACQLRKNQRFEEARRWFHFIFNPTLGPSGEGATVTSSARFWRFAPFFEAESGLRADEIASLMASDPDDLSPQLRARREEFERQLERLNDDPFDPHTVARTRTRAYQFAVVMHYIDNLIDWGDQLFRQDTMESVQESTQLYLLAADILGRHPREVPERNPPTMSFGGLAPTLDATGNARVVVEQRLNTFSTCWHPRTGEESALAVLGHPTYFCVPANEQLLAYWERVADRLFKIRNSLNIDGVRRQLALYEPPIDPAVLVRARAAGVDLATLGDVPVGGAHYRFLPLLQRAVEFTGDVRSLGGQLLGALEKRDAEHVSNLRTVHERSMLERVREVRKSQLDESTRSREALQQSKAIAGARADYYEKLAREPISGRERTASDLHEASVWTQLGAQGLSILASFVAPIPDPTAGAAGPLPFFSARLPGGTKIAHALQAASSATTAVAGVLAGTSSAVATQASYDRRLEEWRHQADQARREIAQLDKQIAAADVRVSIAQRELDNHEQQIENAREVEEFLRDKFTSEELYDWMLRQTASLYFQSYQLAFDLARKAERAYQFERVAPEARFVQAAHWDNLRRGLLAGEKLHLDLRRMEHAYLEQNRRELELTRHVSLAMLDPFALAALKREGTCSIKLPESLFDQDYPGHYQRRIKSVSMSIPAVVGPYAGVHATLTLTESAFRKTAALSSGAGGGTGYARTGADDPRFVTQRGAVQSICTSSGQGDSGVFQLDFRDERYLPFEGAGAESTWQLTLRQADNDFDVSTLTDVVLHVQYTARDGGEALRNAADGARSLIEESRPFIVRDDYRVFSAKQHFATAWQAFTTAVASSATSANMALEGLADRLPTALNGGVSLVDEITLIPVLSPGASPLSGVAVGLRRPSTTVDVPVSPVTSGERAGTLSAVLTTEPRLPTATWSLHFEGSSLSSVELDDLVIVVKTERRTPPQSA